MHSKDSVGEFDFGDVMVVGAHVAFCQSVGVVCCYILSWHFCDYSTVLIFPGCPLYKYPI